MPSEGDFRQQFLLIQFLQFLDPAKGDAVNDGVTHAHHQRWRNHKLAVLVIDLVHCFSDGMRPGAKQFQLLTSG